MSIHGDKMMLIVNPVAGRQDAKKNLAELVQIFTAAGAMVTVFITGKAGDATDFAAKYGSDYDIIVCSGGDGTMNETVAGMVRGGVSAPVGYLPSGSYNDFAEYQGRSVATEQGFAEGQYKSQYFKQGAEQGGCRHLVVFDVPVERVERNDHSENQFCAGDKFIFIGFVRGYMGIQRAGRRDGQTEYLVYH